MSDDIYRKCRFGEESHHEAIKSCFLLLEVGFADFFPKFAKGCCNGAHFLKGVFVYRPFPFFASCIFSVIFGGHWPL